MSVPVVPLYDNDGFGVPVIAVNAGAGVAKELFMVLLVKIPSFILYLSYSLPNSTKKYKRTTHLLYFF